LKNGFDRVAHWALYEGVAFSDQVSKAISIFIDKQVYHSYFTTEETIIWIQVDCIVQYLENTGSNAYTSEKMPSAFPAPFALKPILLK